MPIVHKAKLTIIWLQYMNYLYFQVYILHLLLVLDFQDHVFKQLTHIKFNLFKLDEKLSALNYPLLQNVNIDTYNSNILENVPI